MLYDGCAISTRSSAPAVKIQGIQHILFVQFKHLLNALWHFPYFPQLTLIL